MITSLAGRSAQDGERAVGGVEGADPETGEDKCGAELRDRAVGIGHVQMIDGAGRLHYRRSPPVTIRLMRAAFLLLLSLPLLATNFTGKVVAITDGDTIRVMHAGRSERVRLFGIDCPEKAQGWGTRARQFAGSMVFGKTVTIRVHDTDRYGRPVGEVVLPDGRSLNRELVRAGLAWWYRQYAPRDAELERLEADARRERRGLWADPQPVPPWDWRRAGMP